jgi:hypothetical protein
MSDKTGKRNKNIKAEGNMIKEEITCEFQQPIVSGGKELMTCAHAHKKYAFCRNNRNFGTCPEHIEGDKQ